MAPKKTPRLSQFQRQRCEAADYEAKLKATDKVTEEVLNLPELLELILQNLDMKTLLLAQRVNSSFKAVIECSVECQDKLFLRLKEVRGQDGVDMFNPLLVKDGPPDCKSAELANCFCHDCFTKPWTYAFDLSTMPLHASACRMALSWRQRKFFLRRA